MTARETLERHAQEFRQVTDLLVEIVKEDGNRIFVVIRQVLLPAGLFKIGRSDMLFLTDKQYPFSALDMFWTEVDVVRADGAIPQGAEQIETYLGRQWRRFSWHRNGVWNPTSNGLLDHFSFVESAWAAEARK